jgi:hypothetical protein
LGAAQLVRNSIRALSLVVLAGLGTSPASADTFRVAYFHTELTGRGPGLLLRDLQKDKTPPKLAAVLAILSEAAPDILLLGGIDYDAGGETLAALQTALARTGLSLGHGFAAAPNTGVPTGHDLDNDGRLDEPEDTQAFGEFRGAGGLALLSRYPLLRDRVTDLTDLLWSEFPAADLPVTFGPEIRASLPLSATGHWDVPVQLPDGSEVRLLTLHATPPVFDGPEDRNGRRNADQLRLWADYLNGWRPGGPAAPLDRAIVLGTLNADPADGESRPGALDRLLLHPLLQDPAPRAPGAAQASARQGGVNSAQTGDPAFDTVDWPDAKAGNPGNLRVDYILPGRSLRVVASGMHWPGADQPDALDRAEIASRHRLIWVDIAY